MDGPIPKHLRPRRGVTLDGPLPEHLQAQPQPDARPRPDRQRKPDVQRKPDATECKDWAAAKHGVDRAGADAELAVAAGMKHLVAGRLGAAYVELKRATTLDPTSRQAEVWLLVCEARVARSEGHTAAAQRKYAAVLELDPTHREALAETTEAPAEPSGKTRRLGRWFGGGRD